MRKIESPAKEFKREHKKPYNVWRSYSDMMAGLLLVFILVMAVSLIEAQRSYEAELESRKLQESLSIEVQKQKEEVEAQQARLKEQQNTLDKQQELLDEQKAALAEQTRLLQSQQEIMDMQQEKIDKIIGIKAELIKDLKSEFAGNNLSVSIDEGTGAIIFDSNVLFEYNKSVLTAEGRQMLEQMLPIYCRILMGDKYREYLSEVMIDGFTDTKGDYDYNMKLSQDRAYAVASYLLSIEHSFLSEDQAAVLESKMSANGRSESNPVLDENNQVDMAASRRVEVKFRLKDDEMISELQNIMNDPQN